MIRSDVGYGILDGTLRSKSGRALFAKGTGGKKLIVGRDKLDEVSVSVTFSPRNVDLRIPDPILWTLVHSPHCRASDTKSQHSKPSSSDFPNSKAKSSLSK